jgi:tetratricopeptide (TPR) repeat protein
MIEKGENPDNALMSFRKGIKFAALADEAFEGTTFSNYANSFASLSPSEQKNFRESQKAFKQGMKETDPKMAKQRLEQSLALARSLGDTWGQAMAWSGLAETAQKAGDNEEALRAAMQAVELNRSLQLRDDCVQMLLMAAVVAPKISVPEAKVKGRAGQASLGYLSQAFNVVQFDLDIDEALRTSVLDQYVAALEAAGLKDRAETARRDFQPSLVTAGATTAPAN